MSESSRSFSILLTHPWNHIDSRSVQASLNFVLLDIGLVASNYFASIVFLSTTFLLLWVFEGAPMHWNVGLFAFRMSHRFGWFVYSLYKNSERTNNMGGERAGGVIELGWGALQHHSFFILLKVFGTLPWFMYILPFAFRVRTFRPQSVFLRR